jgi:hypothetical protein
MGTLASVLFVLGEFLHYFYLVDMILTHKNDFSEKMALLCWILRNVKIKLPHLTIGSSTIAKI